MDKRELIALLNLSSLCLMMVERLFLAVPRGCLRFVIVVFPDHTHLLFLKILASDCIIEKYVTAMPLLLYYDELLLYGVISLPDETSCDNV